MFNVFRKMVKQMRIYFLALVFSQLGFGFTDSVFANYFKETYHITTMQRAILEFPRELPGILCVFITAFMAFIGNLKLMLIAQGLMVIGVLLLGLLTPPLAIMIIFLFISSIGMHMCAPLQDSIGMSLAEEGRVGNRMGQYTSLKTGADLFASLLVFVGFFTGIFSFASKIKIVFIVGAVMFFLGFCGYFLLQKNTKQQAGIPRRVRLVFRKEYKYYYIMAIVNGVQKQILFVFAPWILIDLLSQKTDTIAILGVISASIGMIFLPVAGKWVDRFGVKKLLLIGSASLIFFYICYGAISGGLLTKNISHPVLVLLIICLIFVLDKMISSLGMIRSIYLNSIALEKADVIHSLATGLSLDHVVSITFAYIGGIVWSRFGPQYVFLIASALTTVNLFVAILIKPAASAELQPATEAAIEEV
jgi:MFS family permease